MIYYWCKECFRINSYEEGQVKNLPSVSCSACYCGPLKKLTEEKADKIRDLLKGRQPLLEALALLEGKVRIELRK